MSEILDRAKAQPVRAGIVDCDIHPTMRSKKELDPWLPERWRKHLAEYGHQVRIPFTSGTQYPKSAPATARRDAWPPAGGPPGSDLDFMRRQLLDANDIAWGVLAPLSAAARNTDLGAAYCNAVNEWQVEKWVKPEPRLRACVTVAQDDAALAVAEIEHRAGDPRFVQILLPSKTTEPMGRKRYWPIFAAACAANLPVAVHVNSVGGGYASTAGGWPSYYLQDHHLNVHSFQAQIASLVLEGAFEHHPSLRMVMIEGGSRGCRCWRGGWTRRGNGCVTKCRNAGVRRRSISVSICGSPPSRWRSRKPRSPARYDRLDRLGQDHVRHGLPALGL